MSAESPRNKSELDPQIENVSDPFEAFGIVATNELEGQKLDPSHIEKLKDVVRGSEVALFNCYMDYVESGITEDATPSEQELMVWAEEILKQTQESEVAAYLLQHSTTLTETEREYLREVGGFK